MADQSTELHALLMKLQQTLDERRKEGLGVYQRFDEGCPALFRVNVYKGCKFQCRFCYDSTPRPRADRRVVRHLPGDIELAVAMGVPRLPVMVSCSSDPLQPELERETGGDTGEVLRVLADNGYPIVLMTQNPAGLLEGRYLESLEKVPSVVEVTVPSMDSGPAGNGLFHTYAPPAPERFEAAEQLIRRGMVVRVRLDPLIPLLDETGPGQIEEDIRRIVEKSAQIGVSMVISKAMRLTPGVGRFAWRLLEEFYRANAEQREDGQWVLLPEVQRRLLLPVRGACRDFRVPFCTCVSPATFDECVPCLLV